MLMVHSIIKEIPLHKLSDERIIDSSESCLISEIQIESKDEFERIVSNSIPLWKRTFDIAGAIIGLVILSPLLCIITLAIKITSHGPIFFIQERVGYLGKRFRMYKFRSMYSDADEKEHEAYVRNLITQNNGNALAMVKIPQDSRVTPLGRFLRKLSLDELPQLINVLKGEMTLIGPRPPVPYEVEEYYPWHRKRLEMYPGITGLWQVSGKNTTTFNQMVRLDVRYGQHVSPLMDAKILLKTIPTVLSLMIEKCATESGRKG